MRLRLLAILLSLVGAAVIALDIPLAASLANGERQKVFSDRLSDLSWFASQAEQAYRDGEDFATFQENLNRYDDVFDTPVALVFRHDSTIRVASRQTFNVADDEVQRHIRTAVAGRPSDPPKFDWPTNPDPLVVAVPVRRNGDVVAVLVATAPTDRLRAAILREWTLIAMGSLIAIALFAAGAARLSAWVLRPVRRLDSATNAIAAGQYEARVDADSGPPELRRLASAFNEMVDVVVETMEQQRAFVANASHQLRNPLGALLLRVEMLGMEAPAELSDDFAEAQQEGRRLTEVLDELLTLARAERAATAPATEVDPTAIAEDRVRNWRLAAERRDISLAFTSEPELTAMAEQTALSSCLDAVVDNALKFSPAGSTVRVAVRRVPDLDPPTLEIAVSDQGPGLPAEELPRLGDRFWRSNSHQNISGSGLGLSIVVALLGPYGGGLHVEPVEPTGLTVALRVPAAVPISDSEETDVDLSV